MTGARSDVGTPPNELPASDDGVGAPTLVLLHSFGGARGAWRDCVAILSQRYRCVALDLPGFGDAARITGYTVAAMGDAVDAAVRRLGDGPFVLVGHSMSGKIAMALAARRSTENLAGLVLATPSPPSPEPIEAGARRRMLAMARTRACGEAFIDRITATPLDGESRERAVADFIACSPAAWVAWLERGSEDDLAALVGVIECPALLVTGALDPALPAAVQRKFTVPHLARVDGVDIPRCGHLPPLEAPGTLAGLIADFVHRRIAAPTEPP